MNIGSRVKILNGIFVGHEGEVNEDIGNDQFVIIFPNLHTEVYDLADLEVIETSDDVESNLSEFDEHPDPDGIEEDDGRFELGSQE